MQKKVENTNSTSTFHFYSGHDVLIAVILKTLRIYDGINPPLGASVVLEVRKKPNEHIVIVSYTYTYTSIIRSSRYKYGKGERKKFYRTKRPYRKASFRMELRGFHESD